MRLLHTKTFKLHESVGDDVPLYAILSHRWEDEEVIFSDLEAGKAKKRRGWEKIVGCCKQARDDGFQFIVSE
jgi:hypothetical protein